jgi:hypothetical protein
MPQSAISVMIRLRDIVRLLLCLDCFTRDYLKTCRISPS